MADLLKTSVIAVVLALCFGAAQAQNGPTPRPEDAEKNAFQTPTTGKKDQPSTSEKTGSKDMNPESRLNDSPPANEKVGTTNTPGK
jgi:hypothetical protein